MIFSLAESKIDFVIPERDGLDVFCFFDRPHAVKVPPHLWFQSICASLQRKHEVLILETGVQTYPEWDTSKRWVIGESWCWLAPRSLSVLLEAISIENPDYSQLMTFLVSSK